MEIFLEILNSVLFPIKTLLPIKMLGPFLQIESYLKNKSSSSVQLLPTESWWGQFIDKSGIRVDLPNCAPQQK